MISRHVVALLVLAAAFVPAPALAQSDDDKATARALGAEGAKALDAGDWQTAVDRFKKADGIFHAPTLTLGLAHALAKGGKVVEAWESYHRIIVENVTSPAFFAKALSDAQAEIGTVERKRARVTVNVTGAPAQHVTINDVPMRLEALGLPHFVNPGHVVVAASADGFATATKALDFTEGQEQTVTLTLQKASAAPAVVAVAPAVTPATAPPAAAPPEPAASPSSSSSGGSILKPLGIGALALGGAGIVLGAVTGGLALGDVSTLKTDCPGGTCRTSSAQSKLSSYHTMEALSTVGFIVGGVGLAGGITMILLAPKGEKAPAPAAAYVTPYFGFGSAGVTGRF